MKKLILFALLIAFGLRSNAQSVTLSLITSPCDSNGVVVATFSGISPPFIVGWLVMNNGFSYPPYSHADTITTGTTDTLWGFEGGTVHLGVSYGSSFGSWFSDTASFAAPFAVTITTTNSVCPALGSMSAMVTGGTGPFSYEWINFPAFTLASTANPAALPSGAYVLKVADMTTGCTQYLVGYPDALYVTVYPDFTQTVTTTPSICPALGAGIVSVTGGTTPFEYSWTNVATGVVYTSSSSPVSLPCCFYVENTTDGLGCISNGGSWSVGYVSDFTATVTTTSADCTNGTASVTISGGTGPFGYLWSNGATTPSITGLITGTYYLTVVDALGCTDGLSGNVAQTITINDSNVTTPATCIAINGSVTAFGSGGTPPYSYLWSDGGTTQTISGLATGDYSVTVTDANGCLGWGTGYVTSSTPITVTYTTTPSACTTPTGSATLTISGGTPPYAVIWYTTPPQTGVTATSLLAGNYYFTITDAMGCTQHGTVTVPPVDVISLSFSATPATCAASDGSVFVAASGGYTPYTYSWNTGATTATLSDVPYGTYTATVTDAHGCKASNCQLVPYVSPLELGLSSTPASCLYTSNGSITATAALGTPPYTYSMGGSSSGSVTVPGLATGPYWIYVSDAMGCTAEAYTYVDYNVLDSSCFCVVQGNVYDDLAVDCSPAGDPGIQNIQLQASGFGYTYTNPDGYYYFLLPSGTYTISQTVLSIYPLSPCQVNNISYTSVAATGCYQTINFADTLNPIHDMHICTWDYTKPVPGFSYTQTTIVTNNGTITEPGVLASYVTDGQLFSPTFVPSGVFNGAADYYSTAGTFPSLTPGAGQEFLETYNVPADIPLGTNVITKDTVAYTSPMSNWLNDYSPWNNVDYFTTTTVGSFDPNFKEVNPVGTGPEGFITPEDTVLEYMIHFQNVGTYMAQNVVVIDSLDPNLDWATLKPEFLSNKGVVDINEHGVATFTFSNIDLPPVSSEPITSNGMFTYTVRVRPGLAFGTHIKNRASIYFDFNAPVMTNQTLNTIGGQLQTPTTPGATANNSFTIFPNPAQNSFTAIINVNTAGTYKLNVTDVTGKTDITKTLSLLSGTQNITVDANRLAPGVYFVTLNGSDNVIQTQKLVIIK